MNNLRGALCSINGNKYEKDVYNIVKNCTLNGILFNEMSQFGDIMEFMVN